MKIRFAGLVLIACGLLFAVLFVYLPLRDGGDGFIGPVSLKALVFVPLAVVAGLTLLIAGPKFEGQFTLVLLILIGSGVLTGLGYWQIKTRWLRPQEPVILDASPKVPVLPDAR